VLSKPCPLLPNEICKRRRRHAKLITRYVTLAWKDPNNIVEEMSPKPEK
jgi:hypothetical protein